MSSGKILRTGSPPTHPATIILEDRQKSGSTFEFELNNSDSKPKPLKNCLSSAWSYWFHAHGRPSYFSFEPQFVVLSFSEAAIL
jgi:hypothetical protein